MQALYSPQSYPQSVKDELAKQAPLATEILNRWMLGWPKRVKALIEAGLLMELLISQEQLEREAYSAPGNRHLARHEIAELYGLSADAPMWDTALSQAPSRPREATWKSADADRKRIQTADLSKVKVW